MKPYWQYNHIIDLEYLFHQDLEGKSQDLHKRDRDIFLLQEDQLQTDEKPDTHQLLHLWQNKRIEEDFSEPGTRSPGSIFQDSHLLAKNLLVVKGLLAGLIGGFSFFTYTGTTPVNVFNFIILFVISQLVLVSFLLCGYLLRFFIPSIKLPSFYTSLFRSILSRIATLTHKRWRENLPAKKRLSVNHAFGIFKGQNKVYGSLFYWPLFVLAQLFAIGFNVGLLAVTLLKISTSDLAFGWQSTLQFSSAAIHQTAKLAALPWSWFVSPENSYPSLGEIEGSRIILKEGIYHLATQDLIAWWPFLIFCLLFYGLFPRILCLLLGKYMERRSFTKLHFDTPPCLAVVRRMLTPLVTTQAIPESEQHRTLVAQESKGHQLDVSATNLLTLVALIPDDIFDLCPAEKLGPLLRSQGLGIDKIYRFMVGYDEDRHLVERLTKRNWKEGEGVFVLMEAWMPPLVDFLSLLKELRAILPERSIIHLGLVGRPTEAVFSAVNTDDYRVWQQKVEAAGDPYLNLFSLPA